MTKFHCPNLLLSSSIGVVGLDILLAVSLPCFEFSFGTDLFISLSSGIIGYVSEIVVNDRKSHRGTML